VADGRCRRATVVARLGSFEAVTSEWRNRQTR
jgi:hypothetical protein